MSRRLIAAAALLALAGGAAALPPARPPEAREVPRERIALIPEFFDVRLFDRARRRAEAIPDAEVRQDVRAVVLPHHLLAAPLIAGTLRAASGAAPATVVIIGPNHENAGASALAATQADWATPGGSVTTDDAAVGRFAETAGARIDASAFRREHSIGAVVPFIEAEFPEAEIVPVIAASYAGRREAEALAAWLMTLDKKTLVVFSIDFSHYLTPPVSDRMDAETLQVILSRDVETLLGYGSDHLDAPAPMAAFVLWASRAGLTPCVWAHANANDFLERDEASVTGYYALALSETGVCGKPLENVLR